MGMMRRTLPYVGMVGAQVAQVLLIIISKEAMSSGMTNFTFVFYSNALASFILLPISLLTHRSAARPPLTFSHISGFFFLGVIGCLVQLSGYAGIRYTNAEFASAMLNLIPAFTFILAVIFRMETLDFRSSSTLGKISGTVLSIAGAFIVTLYKGPPILNALLHSNTPHQHLFSQPSKWVIGGLLLAVDSALSSAFTIVQALILKKYPAELIIVFFYCFFAAILTAAVSLIGERDTSAWSLQPNIRLIAVVYSGVFGSAFQVGITTWCLHQTGPLFVAMFHPLGIVISAALGVIFLGDTFYLGSLVGSIVIVIGFYSVMWGRAKEGKMVEDNGVKNSESTSEEAPLLQNIGEETRV